MTITIQTLWLIGMQSVVHYPKHHKHSRDCVMKAQSLENALILGYASQGNSKEVFSLLERMEHEGLEANDNLYLLRWNILYTICILPLATLIRGYFLWRKKSKTFFSVIL